MRDQTKVVIGLGSIWGLFALGAMLLASFTLGANDTIPESVAIILYGLTLLPSCILSIWYRKPAAVWLIALSLLTAFGLMYQVIEGPNCDQTKTTWTRDSLTALLVTVIPAVLGYFLFKSELD